MAGAGHQRRGRNAALHQRLEQTPLLGDRHRVRLAVGTEDRESRAAAVQEPAAMAHEAICIGRIVLLERRDHWREHALDALHFAPREVHQSTFAPEAFTIGPQRLSSASSIRAMSSGLPGMML